MVEGLILPERILAHLPRLMGASDKREGKQALQFAPFVPAVKFIGNVGSRKPDKIRRGKTGLQGLDRVIGADGSQITFQIGHKNAGIGHQLAAMGDAGRQVGQVAFVFERIARRHQPPDSIQPQIFHGNVRGMNMTGMGRVKRPPEQPNAHPAPSLRVMKGWRSEKGGTSHCCLL